ncbi:uncharacterized protein BX663DRAFT_500459 [Cokeromyces recurvatus]|uniref:uncharacterized protein n=1 Tax=Cokeromyces recurvatus TaxID=90255 RepID=UPI00221E507E|nr:uncharacterized protein BX663DRAFT_500459 [Cokeromyces recurvatus]KAI7905643.1 hypothetical protein BX663DRAFT_500459 [Cokeromyces recurvatus]
MSGGNIKVVVRCRPLNSRELARGATCLIRMEGNQTIITKPAGQKTNQDAEDTKSFTFDKSYWSANKSDPHYADQNTVYNDLGEDLLNHAFDGYNCCIFAYGQTGAGKSYSMMGYGDDKGITPKTCCELFNRITDNTDPNLTYRVEVSYIEIYNEKVRDLLNPKNKGNLKVREHPSLGPYVEDLSRLVVRSFDDINDLMDEGNKARTVAATNMNETSSRSHAVFTLFLTQVRIDETTKLETEKVARISLVDLAGSERANSTGATGARLKEGANINRSLTTLGKVISGLAEQSILTESTKRSGKKGKDIFIPYRDSVLTWLLKDSLGGNSKTAMIAAISPADYDETLSTLRYADQTKKIQNKAVVNEDPNAKMIRELKEELSTLRERLRVYAPEAVEELASVSGIRDIRIQQPLTTRNRMNQVLTFTDTQGNTKKMSKQEIVDQLQCSEKLLANLNETWEEKLKRTEEIHQERELSLKELGITIDKNEMGVYMPKTIPFIVNLNEDPLMSECLMYQIKSGKTRVGRQDGQHSCEIRLSGANVYDEHCWFEQDQDIVTLYPSQNKDALTMVNGIRIYEPHPLKNGYRIILGHHHIFRFNHPEEVRKERSKNTSRTDLCSPPPLSPPSLSDDCELANDKASSTTLFHSEVMDWNFARLEALRNHYSTETNISGLNDEEIEKIYDDIGRIRNSRRTTRIIDDEDDSSSSKSLYQLSTSATMVDDGSICTDITVVATQEKIIQDAKEKHQRELSLQKSFYEAQIHRMSSMHQILNIPVYYTERQIELIQTSLQRWKGLRYVSMAEVILTHAALLKEANIISRKLEKQIIYQFTIIEENFSHLKSYWEETSNLSSFDEDEEDNTANATTFLHSSSSSSSKPCIGIRVIDHKNQSIYVWSIAKLKKRLYKMRNLLDFMDRPHYRKHLNWEDPFYETPCPRYSFIGAAAISVRNLAFKKPQAYESCVEILCRITGQVKGKLRVLISPVTRTTQANINYFTEEPLEMNINDKVNVKDQDRKEDDILQVGEQLLFEIRILELTGLNEDEFTDVHVQYRLSSFGSVSRQQEELFATPSSQNFGNNNSIQLDYSQTFSILITERTKDILISEMVYFELYGRAKARFLSSCERWDDQREKPQLIEMLAENNKRSDPLLQPMDHHVVPQQGLLETERHDILAWIQICELMPDGKYIPVVSQQNSLLDRGVFLLRQGLQRRIQITLMHNSGRQLVWSKISKATIGHVRLLDTKGRIINSPTHEDVMIRLLFHQEVQYNNDGTSTLTAQGAWDSSQHDCIFLNRLTTTHTSILLNLKWEIEVDTCSKPIQCAMDIAIRIQDRDASNFGIRKLLLGPSRQLTKQSGVFLISLRSPTIRRVSQLWRLNTATKQIPGEEYLRPWRPRGVSLVNDYRHIQERIQRKEQVEIAKQAIIFHQTRSQTSQSLMTLDDDKHHFSTTVLETKKTNLIRKVLSLWNSKWETTQEIILCQDPPIPGMQGHQNQTEMWSLTTKLISEVKLITEFDNVTRKGYLIYQENALDNKWTKRWFVLRRPYIYIYTNQSEVEERGIINICNVRIDYNQALEELLKRNYVFSIYTNNNAYILQANSKSDMLAWMKNIDKLYVL